MYFCVNSFILFFLFLDLFYIDYVTSSYNSISRRLMTASWVHNSLRAVWRYVKVARKSIPPPTGVEPATSGFGILLSIPGHCVHYYI